MISEPTLQHRGRCTAYSQVSALIVALALVAVGCPSTSNGAPSAKPQAAAPPAIDELYQFIPGA